MSKAQKTYFKPIQRIKDKFYFKMFVCLVFSPLVSGASQSLIQTSKQQLAKEAGLFSPSSKCERSFVYQNRTYPVDSVRKQDGEGLRFVLSKNKSSEELLNDYQGKKKPFYIPAYVATLGVVMAATAPLLSSTRSSAVGREDTRNVSLYTGLTLLVGGLVWGQVSLHKKENALEKAIETYNDAAVEPERIKVDLSPTSSGDGGEVRTVVPF